MPTYEFTSPDGKTYQVDGPEGSTKEQAFSHLQAQLGQFHVQPKQENSFLDSVRAIPGGLAQGIAGLVGLPGDISHLANVGLDKLTGANVAPKLDQLQVNSTNINNAISKPFGGYYEPKTTAGQYAQTAASFAPALLGGEASLARRALGRVLAPAVTSETAGQVTKGSDFEGPARFAGALLGGAPAAIGAGARAVGQKLIPKLTQALPEEDANLVSSYEKMGGQLRPGQYNPSNFIRQGDAIVADSPFPRAAGFKANDPSFVHPAQQSEQFNSLLSRTFGEDSPRITDATINNAHDRIGRVYSDVLPRNTVQQDPQLVSELDRLDSAISASAPAMDPRDVTKATAVINHIRNQAANEGGFTGHQYQLMRQRNGLLDELGSGNSPVLQSVSGDLRKTLDTAFERQATPEDAAALRGAREQYRNLKVIEPLAAKAPAGNISPGLVLGAVNKEFGNPGNAGDLGTLARVGSAFLKSQPSSGTAERSVWRNLLNNPLKGSFDAVSNMAALPVAATAGRVVNKAINSPQMRQKLLANALQNQEPSVGAALDPTHLGQILRKTN